MKYGCCLGFSANNMDGLSDIKSSGAEFIETSLTTLSKFSDADIAHLIEITRSLSMPCVAVNAMFPPEIKLVGKNIDYAPAKEYMWKAFEKIAPSDIKHVTFGSGKARQYPDDMSHKEATEQLIYLLSEIIAPAAEKYGLICGIEPLNSAETNIFTTCSETFKVVKTVNKPSIRMIVDYFHFAKEQEPTESLMNYKGYISHMHISSYTNNRQAPQASDTDNYKAFVKMLREIGCGDGYLSIEGGIPEPFHETLTKSLSFIKVL